MVPGARLRTAMTACHFSAARLATVMGQSSRTVQRNCVRPIPLSTYVADVTAMRDDIDARIAVEALATR